MAIRGTVRKRLTSCVFVVATVLLVTLGAYLVLRLTTGHGFGLGLMRIVPLTRAVLDRSNVTSYSHGEWTNIIFLHHSTGENLIEQGGIRQRFAQAGYDFWDQGYNDWGLTRPDGTPAGYSYYVPNDNTDPDGLATIFAQPVYDLPRNAMSGLLQHEVIVFKSCFPVSNITNDEQLQQYKAYYLAMRDVMDQHPDKLFVVMSPPPLNPAATNAGAATRARAFADWLKSDEYLSGHTNVVTFDFFGSLAEGDPALPDHNMLRQAYREGTDSHPNQVANEVVGPLFVGFIANAIEDYRSSAEQ